ncbi:MAG: TetR/AcrR family transcriptional regulator, ethionamide resistance regulator [Solirubrobacteraceae bacterium]|nr:TetR/AcrR family transcriptional regulator, ethionamide resistance regulator [Solirubrobacteraceae bacterium]
MSTSDAEPQPTVKRAQIQASVLAATEALLEGGVAFADLNIERIARGAGISRTAFYFYFRDKRELLMRLTEDVTGLLYAQAEQWYSGEGGDPADEVRGALTSVAQLYDTHFPLLRAIVEVSTYDEEVAVFWRGLLGRFVDATQRRMEHEQRAGNAPASTPARATAFALVWMTERTFYQQVVQDRPISQDELVEGLAGVWTRAIYGAG